MYRYLLAPLLGAILCVFPATANASSLLTNGGFETGDFTGWTVVNPDGNMIVAGFNPHTGSFAAELGTADQFGFLSQTVSTTPGALYRLDYWLNGDGNPTATTNEFQVSWNGQFIFDQTNLPDTVYHHYLFPNLAVSGTSTVLQFAAQDNVGFLSLDDVSLVAVPEPATLGLGVAAFIAMLALSKSVKNRPFDIRRG